MPKQCAKLLAKFILTPKMGHPQVQDVIAAWLKVVTACQSTFCDAVLARGAAHIPGAAAQASFAVVDGVVGALTLSPWPYCSRQVIADMGEAVSNQIVNAIVIAETPAQPRKPLHAVVRDQVAWVDKAAQSKTAYVFATRPVLWRRLPPVSNPRSSPLYACGAVLFVASTLQAFHRVTTSAESWLARVEVPSHKVRACRSARAQLVGLLHATLLRLEAALNKGTT